MTFVLTFIFILFISDNVALNNTKLSEVEIDRLCLKLKVKHHVVVGESWGTLTEIQQNFWMKNRCDKHFCKPNRLEGLGVYKCDPV